MTKFEIRSPALLTAAALVLAPAFALAGNEPSRSATTTTTTTTAPQGNATTAPQGNTIVTPPTSSDMNPGDMKQVPSSTSASNPSLGSDIDPAQVQKVFGMDVALIDLKSLNREQIKVLQQRLAERGFYRAAIDGKMGPGTRNALAGLMAQQFALNQRLINQGQITEQFATNLGVDTRGRVPVSGVDRGDQPSQHPAPRSNVPSNDPNVPSNAPTPPNQ